MWDITRATCGLRIAMMAVAVSVIVETPVWAQAPQRCATFFDEAWREAASGVGDCSLGNTNPGPYIPGSGDRVYYVPVVFHVISRPNGEGDISDAFIQSQIRVLNEDFRALAMTPGESGYDTRIEFFLARVDPNGNPTDGINRVTNQTWYYFGPNSAEEDAAKAALNWDTTKYLNIYTNDGAGYLGWATFPQQTAGQFDDGIVCNWRAVGFNSPLPPFDLGRTATHEAGHYFGLLHTFSGGCGTASCYTTGDLICDTEPEQFPHGGCAASYTCGTPDPIDNYMNYTDDFCMEMFTAEQAGRMRCAIDSYRADLVATEWQGEITTNTTWSGTVFVSGDLRVNAGATLTLDPGTSVYIYPTSAIDLNIAAQQTGLVDISIVGALEANGTAQAPISVVSNKASPTDDDWYQLQVSGSGMVDMSYVTLANGCYGIASMTSATVSVDNCTFEESEYTDFTIGGDPQSFSITNSTFNVGEGRGIKVGLSSGVSQNVIVRDNVFFGDDESAAGVEVYQSTNALIDGNTFSGFQNLTADSNALFIYSTATVLVVNNLIQNSDYGIQVAGQANVTVGSANNGNEITGNAWGIATGCVGPGTCSSSCIPSVRVRHNEIHGNACGVVTIENIGINLGTFGDYGFNTIEDNTAVGVWNDSSCGTLSARGNNWGRQGNNCFGPSTQGDVDANEVWCPCVSNCGGGGGKDTPTMPKAGAKPTHTRILAASIDPRASGTTIQFGLAKASIPTLSLYDVRGALIREINVGERQPGIHEWTWDRESSSGRQVSSGIYFVVLSAGDVIHRYKAVLLR